MFGKSCVRFEYASPPARMSSPSRIEMMMPSPMPPMRQRRSRALLSARRRPRRARTMDEDDGISRLNHELINRPRARGWDPDVTKEIGCPHVGRATRAATIHGRSNNCLCGKPARVLLCRNSWVTSSWLQTCASPGPWLP